MQPNGGILEEVGQLLLIAPQIILGGLPFDELGDASGYGSHHFQEVRISLLSSPGDELNDAECLTTDCNRTGECALESIWGRGG
jgi:hypothetical protein